MSVAENGVRRFALPVLARLAVVLTLMMGLSACAIPPAISIASLAADGVLLAATGKSKTDHGLSLATGRDCATFRIFDDQNVCQDDVVAQIEPMPAEVERELDRLRSPSVATAPPPRVALATAFAGTSGVTVAQLTMPRHLSSADVRGAQSRAPSPVPVAVAVASPGPFKVALVAPPKSTVLQRAGYKSGRAIAANAGARFKAAKLTKKVATVGPSRKAGKKVASLANGTAKGGVSVAKGLARKVSALAPNRGAAPPPLPPVSRKVSSAQTGHAVQLAMR
ncbi:hypothetical protein [Magnetospirillum moscoviense]|uniref:hypothetical protein n=1 Tax=Magnetospirillum moscoviense TaxID=1437059 RepID=UPI0012E8BDA4|nr:hypothetical protein [Magnetospirillum moscoviense]